MPDDRPKRIEILITLSNGVTWTLDAFETESGKLGLTLSKGSGDNEVSFDIIQNNNGFIVA